MKTIRIVTTPWEITIGFGRVAVWGSTPDGNYLLTVISEGADDFGRLDITFVVSPNIFTPFDVS